MPNEEKNPAGLLADPLLFVAARCFLSQTDCITSDELAEQCLLSAADALKAVMQLERHQIIQEIGSSRRFSLNESKRADLSCAQKQIEREFLSSRAASNSIDVVGRLEWIEDAYCLIQTAKKARNEAL